MAMMAILGHVDDITHDHSRGDPANTDSDSVQASVAESSSCSRLQNEGGLK